MTNTNYAKMVTDNNREIAITILNQLGGRRFAVMTGAKDFLAVKNGLQFKIGRNISKANRVEIKLNGLDLYDVRFYRQTGGNLNKNYEWVPVKETEVKTFNDCYCDMLEDIFTSVTGLYTRF